MLAFIIALVFLSPTYLLAQADSVCVVNFERQAHPYTKVVKEIFGGKRPPRVMVYHNAGPLHFLECIKSNATEIIVIAHALEMGEGSERYNLGYFRPLSLEDKKNLKKVMLEKKGEEEVKKINWNEELYFPPLPILPKIFEKSLSYLRQKKQAGQNISLKRIRLMSCEPEKILERYQALTQIIEEFSLQVQLAPTDAIGGLLNGKEVTKMDYHWLAESAQFVEDGDPYFYTYLPLNTYLFYREGESFALRGKYHVQVDGMALGLSSQWSVVFIAWQDVRGLKVGESHSILVPHLDLSLALGINAEVGFSPKLNLKLPSETNSVGAKLGLFSSITVTRMY